MMLSDTPDLHELMQSSVGLHLGRISRLWRAMITNTVAPLGLTEARWTALLLLVKIGEGCTQKQLAHELGIEMPSLTRTLNQLEEQGLVERRRDPRDGRAHTLWFTDEGKECVRKMSSYVVDARNKIFDGLSEEQVDTLLEVLKTMEANICTHLNKEARIYDT